MAFENKWLGKLKLCFTLHLVGVASSITDSPIESVECVPIMLPFYLRPFLSAHINDITIWATEVPYNFLELKKPINAENKIVKFATICTAPQFILASTYIPHAYAFAPAYENWATN